MVVQHYRKIKTGVGLRNVAAHNAREKVYDETGKLIENDQLTGKWIHPEFARLNKHFFKNSPIDVLARRSERITTANLTRKPQKNASHAVEGVYSFSPEFCADWKTNPKSRVQILDYFKAVAGFVSDRFGKENLLQADIHWDEKTPHMHVLLVPILARKNGLTYSSSEFLGGRGGLKTLQNDFWMNVGKGFGLERGIEGSKARHTDQAEWKRELRAKEKTLTIREKELDHREVRIQKAEEQLRQEDPKIFGKVKLTEIFRGLDERHRDEFWNRAAPLADDLRAEQAKEEKGRDRTPTETIKRGRGRA